MDRFRTVTRLEGLVLPEAPRWHKGRLFFSDLFARRIAAFDPARSAAETIVQLDFAPSGLGWRPDGTLLFVAMNERRLCALVDGRVEIVADLASHCVGPANDMVIAADGSAFISGFGFDALAGDAPQPTALVHVDARGAVRTEGQGLMFPNGLAIVDDGRTLIVAETYGQVLTAFSIAAAGGLSEKRAFARFDAMIAPDGVTADAGGGIWCADARSNRCLRVDGTGAITAEAVVPEGRFALACALGGDDGRDLFICTARSLDVQEIAATRGGGIESLRVEVPHAGRP